MKSRRLKYIFVGALGAVAVFVGMLYLAVSAVELRKIDDRLASVPMIPDEVKVEVEVKCRDIDDAEEIIQKVDDAVCSYLEFSYRNDIPSGKANCVGYAKLTADAINHVFKMKGLPYRAKPVYGRAYVLGFDIHPFVMGLLPQKYKSFFRDHDYTEVRVDDVYIHVDSSLHDLSGLRYFLKQ